MSLHCLLVPYDGSAHADAALRLALDVTGAGQGRVIALAVTWVPRSLPLDPLPSSFDRLENDALDRAEAAASCLGRAIETRLTRARDMAQAIVRAADDVEADAIVLATAPEPYLWQRWQHARIVRAVRRQAHCLVLVGSRPSGGALDTKTAVAAAERLVARGGMTDGLEQGLRYIQRRRTGTSPEAQDT